jgi:hypothetical protein
VKRSRKDLFVTQPPLFFDTPKARGLSRGAINVPRYRADYLERREMEEQQIKRCSTCKVVKPYSEFYTLTESRNLRVHTVGGVTNECKDCMATRYKESHMRRKYGISLEEYNAMYEAQDGKCAICGMPGKSRVTVESDHKRTGAISGTLVVDHDHLTGKVRALLCSLCNVGIGSLRDDLELFRKAIAYIEYHRMTSL